MTIPSWSLHTYGGSAGSPFTLRVGRTPCVRGSTSFANGQSSGPGWASPGGGAAYVLPHVLDADDLRVEGAVAEVDVVPVGGLEKRGQDRRQACVEKGSAYERELCVRAEPIDEARSSSVAMGLDDRRIPSSS
ncbi:hypothetical protein ACRAWF_40820 [Streptomyces sp. L7]